MDLASNVVLVFANVTASKRNLQKYPTGKRRFETAAIVVFSCIMGALSVGLIIEAAKTLAAAEHSTDLNVLNLSCIGVAVCTKFFLFLYCFALRKYPTAMILAQDHRNDIILNVAGIVLSLVGQKVVWWMDPVGGILIASWILINWGQTAIEHVQKFIGESASQIFLNRITYLAMTHHDDILQVDTVRAYSSGAGYFVEVDIVMDPSTPLRHSHDVAEALQVKIETLEDVERAFVHIDWESTHAPEHPC
ncbi:cation efflux protein [Obelidium mucronatum]|nr:cation efflux protein [Obelidium mucronatum]